MILRKKRMASEGELSPRTKKLEDALFSMSEMVKVLYEDFLERKKPVLGEILMKGKSEGKGESSKPPPTPPSPPSSPSSSSSTSNASSHSTTSTIQKQTHKHKSNMPLLKLDVKFELPLYDGELNAEKLDNWIRQIEVYCRIQKIIDEETMIQLASLKMGGTALVWWESRTKHDLKKFGKTLSSWLDFTSALRKQFYPLAYMQQAIMSWQNFRQLKGQTVQSYTQEFRKRDLLLGIPLDTQETLLKYIGGLHSYLRHTILMFNPTSLDEVCVQATHLESRGKNVNVDFVKPFKPTEGKFKGKGKEKFKGKKTNTVKKEKPTCTHCKKEGHSEDRCWILHPELKPTKFGNKEKPKTTATTQTDLGSDSGDETKVTVTGIKGKNSEASTSSSIQSLKVDNEVDEVKRT
jgi:hypothetical protein